MKSQILTRINKTTIKRPGNNLTNNLAIIKKIKKNNGLGNNIFFSGNEPVIIILLI